MKLKAHLIFSCCMSSLAVAQPPPGAGASIRLLLPLLCRSTWKSEETIEVPQALFLTGSRKTFGSCELGNAMRARPKQLG
jgi:hypothetical protein